MNKKNKQMDEGLVQLKNAYSDLKIGDWVRIGFNGPIGYVLKIYNSLEFSGIFNGKFKKIDILDFSVYKEGEIKISSEDKKHLIDIALLIKDENWFRELVN